MSFRSGETIIVTGTIVDSDASAVDLSTFTAFEAVVTDSAGTQLSYSVAGADLSTNPSTGATNSYYFVITATESATLRGNLECKITASFVDGDYSIASKDVDVFSIGFIE